MIILNPAVLTQESVVASNVALSMYPEWNATTAHTTGQRVHYRPMGAPLTHDWEAVRNNTGVPPGSDPTAWTQVSASNRYAALDGEIGAATTNTGTCSITLRPGIVANGLGVFGMKGNTVRVEVIDPQDGLVYDRTRNLQDFTQITSFYAYFFEPLVSRADAVFVDMPNYRQADVRITVDAGPGNPAEIGEIVFGNQRLVGDTNFGTSVGVQSFARKERNEFGSLRIRPGRFIKRANYSVTVPSARLATVEQALGELLDKLTVFIGDPARPETVVLGVLQDFNMPIETPTISTFSLEVEGVI